MAAATPMIAHLKLSSILRILGLLLIFFSLTMLAPIAVSIFYGDGEAQSFFEALLIVLIAGLVVWYPLRRSRGDLRLRDGFLVVALFWCVIGVAGAVPFLVAEEPHMTVGEAVFESVSGFTTTGATVLTGLDILPPSILYYRQQTQWLGGIGIVVLAVALLPLLGIGGMQLLKAETPGPMKDTKLTPRITGTAKALWIVYLVITAGGVIAYRLAGMSLFDAICHTFAAVSTGGFSTHDASIGFFNNPVIESITVVLMALGGASFALHFLAWRHRRFGDYWRDQEFRAYLAVLVATTLVTTLVLMTTADHARPFDAVRSALFHAVSVQTSTGFTIEDFSLWPGVLPTLLIFTSFIGGCAGSTAGGMKVIRWLLVAKQGNRELTRLIHPNSASAIKLGDKPIGLRVVEAVWGFFAAYVIAFTLLMLALMGTGADQVTAFGAIASCMNNLGPGLGAVATNFSGIGPVGEWICTLAMLLGRLEIFPLLVLVSPQFWRG
jgi:trk system potassium uptake protein TrkH